MDEPKGFYKRGYLPHIDAGSVTQFVTFRLADSMPSSVLKALRDEVCGDTLNERRLDHMERVDKYLDSSAGSCVLHRPEVATIVQDAIIKAVDELILLHEWVVMPNHVHVLLTPVKDKTLASITQSIKGGSSIRINRLLGKQGRLWQRESFDRVIRNERDYRAVSAYIWNNPVVAGLCETPESWAFSSANAEVRLMFRDQLTVE